MKKLMHVTEVDGEGIEALLGENVTFFCLNYIYHGKLRRSRYVHIVAHFFSASGMRIFCIWNFTYREDPGRSWVCA